MFFTHDTSTDIGSQPQGGSSYPDISSATFSTGYENYMGPYDFELFSSSSLKATNSPFEDAMVSTYLHMDQMDVSHQADSTYGSPESKLPVTPTSNQPHSSGETTQNKTPLIRRDSAIGAEINPTLLSTDMKSGQGYPAPDPSGQSRRLSLFERRRLRSDA